MRDALTRSVSFEMTRSDEVADGLTLEGYAAVFNSPTMIDSWEGRFEEQIARGAFAKTIRETTPVLQFDHGQHPMLGSIPIGAITTLREDERGLFVRARLTDNWLVQPVRDAIAAGAINGMSFRFSVIRDEWNKENTERTITELRCLELGPVVFPAYTDTLVGVRSEAFDAVESFLSVEAHREALATVLTVGTPRDLSTDAAPMGTSDDAPSEPPAGTREDVNAAPDTVQPAPPDFVAARQRIDRSLKGI